MNLSAKTAPLLATSARIATVFLLATTTVPAEAQVVVFTDLTAEGTYNPSSSFGITGPSHPFQDWDIGSRFVSPANYTLDSVQVPLSSASAQFYGRTAELWLMSDVEGSPGAIIETFHFENLPPHSNTINSTLITRSSSIHPLLSTGNQYWLVASALGDSEIGWNLNSAGYMGYVYRYNNGPWRPNSGPAGAFRILGTPVLPVVPEPSSLAMFGAALAAILGMKATRERALRRDIKREG